MASQPCRSRPSTPWHTANTSVRPGPASTTRTKPVGRASMASESKRALTEGSPLSAASTVAFAPDTTGATREESSSNEALGPGTTATTPLGYGPPYGAGNPSRTVSLSSLAAHLAYQRQRSATASSSSLLYSAVFLPTVCTRSAMSKRARARSPGVQAAHTLLARAAPDTASLTCRSRSDRAQSAAFWSASALALRMSSVAALAAARGGKVFLSALVGEIALWEAGTEGGVSGSSPASTVCSATTSAEV